LDAPILNSCRYEHKAIALRCNSLLIVAGTKFF
jgi:hypothetical protein